MRFAAALIVSVVACSTYDPVDGIPHRELPNTGAAIRAILAEAGNAQVYAIGEYHATGRLNTRAPLSHFTDDIVGRLAPWADDLVVEAWFDASCASEDSVQAQIQAVTNRPPAAADLSGLAATNSKMPMHGLPMTCIEHSSVLDPKGRVDFFRLLVMVTDKLRERTEKLVAQGHSVIVYGGALHNDLYPRWALDELSYAHPLAKQTTVLELDLVVPEIAEPLKMLWQEPWYPLLAKAGPDRVLLWERGPNSYVLILPAKDDAVAQRMRAF
jgi:hypothetical protein